MLVSIRGVRKYVVEYLAQHPLSQSHLQINSILFNCYPNAMRKPFCESFSPEILETKVHNELLIYFFNNK